MVQPEGDAKYEKIGEYRDRNKKCHDEEMFVDTYICHLKEDYHNIFVIMIMRFQLQLYMIIWCFYNAEWKRFSW